jgi:plasmid maintenance system antidote protein VapI
VNLDRGQVKLVVDVLESNLTVQELAEALGVSIEVTHALIEAALEIRDDEEE